MLETLRIKNLAVIDSAEIPFRSGLNILSGETGAGKSIVIEAISLLLGSRASAELIRSGCDEATLEGLFDIAELDWMRERLQRLGFPFEEPQLLIKRIVHRGGRHRIYINGQLATASILGQLCEGLVDLCGQHEHQSLLRATTQLELLDRYGGLTEKTRAYTAEYETYRALRAEQEQLQRAESERLQRADFLKFQVDELRAADLQADEDVELAREKQLLQSAETRVQGAESVRQAFESDEDGVLNQLRAAGLKLRSLAQLDNKLEPVYQGLERALAEADDVSLQLSRYLGKIDLDPERLIQVQERLSLIADLRRKYGQTVAEMSATLNRLESESNELGSVGERLAEIARAVSSMETALLKRARELSKARGSVASLLAKSVTDELKDLKMGEARFQIELNAKTELEALTSTGADQIQYVVQTNRGEPARPLGKIASGGELSRLMLSVRRVISDRGGIGVYLFDEIDAGIGGQTAFEVGKKLKSVAGFNQVICITHLPQVASFAAHHLVVRKKTIGERTVTEVCELSVKERKEELARMLGGPKLTTKSLENAGELLEMAGR